MTVECLDELKEIKNVIEEEQIVKIDDEVGSNHRKKIYMRNDQVQIQNSRSYVDVTKKKVSIFDKNLLEIPTEFDSNGNEIVVFNDVMVAEDITDFNNGVYFMKFNIDEGLDFIVNNGPWMVKNKPLIVQKWDINVCLDKTDPDIIPLWVKICNVPIEAWTVKGISALASKVGKPLVMDNVTASMCKVGIGRVRKNKVEIRTEESRQNGKEEKRKEDKSVKANKDSMTDTKGFIAVQKKKNGGINEKVLKPNYKPNTQKSRFVNQKSSMNGNSKVQYEFQPKKKGNNETKEIVASEEARKENTKENQKPVEKTPTKKAWNVKDDILAAKNRSANKFSVFELYDENKVNEIQDMKNRETVESFIAHMKDPTANDTGIAKCIEKDGMNILETHIKPKRLDKVGDRIFENWEWYSNMMFCDKGCRIMIGLNIDNVNINLIHSVKQSMFCEVTTINGIKVCYAPLCMLQMKVLKEEAFGKIYRSKKRIVGNKAWIIIEDMNVTLAPNKHSSEGSSMTNDMNDFKEFINSIEMEDIESSGLFFTWTKNLFKKKTGDKTGVLKKIDRVITNRMKLSLGDLVGLNQSAFVPNRHI
ncbi:RNA-directed DNA polymerase, eukaryota, reverse transcriptase zinc-binding domain protein [Tanacetum coccineum]